VIVRGANDFCKFYFGLQFFSYYFSTLMCIFVHCVKVIDRERLCSSTEVCSARLDVIITPVRLLRLVVVTVVIDDVNDNSPVFPVSTITVSVYEQAPPGSRFPLPVATDACMTRFPLPVAIDFDSGSHELLRTPTQFGTVLVTTFWESRATSGWRR